MKQPILFSTNLLGYAALGSIVFAFVCTCLAAGLPYWEYYNTTQGTQQTVAYQGLWRYCIDYIPETSSLVNVCGDPVDKGSVATDINVTRASVLLALILEIAAGVFVILATFKQQFKKNYPVHYAAAGSGIASGIFSMLALAVYIARVRGNNYDLHAATACDILSWFVSWTSAGFIIFMVFIKKQDDE